MMTTPTSTTHFATLQRGSQQFYTRFVRVGAIAQALVCAVTVVASILMKVLVSGIAASVGVVLFGVAFALTYRGDGMLGRRMFVYTLLSLAMGGAIGTDAPGQIAVLAGVTAVLVTMASFVLARVDLTIITVVAFATILFDRHRDITTHGVGPDEKVFQIIGIGMLLVQAVAVFLFTANANKNRDTLVAYVTEIDGVVAHAGRIAKGDLTGAVEGESSLSETIRAMLAGLRGMVTRTREATSALSSSAQEIAAMARQQEQGAVEQASAVTQVHKTLAALLEASSEAARSTEDVFRNVELTQRTSELVAQRAAALSSHTRRISALLEIIKTIANKSEILALNAALEGARAGEAGRGFSLVASQMQRLAESVMDSVRDVRALVEDIDSATAATLAATEQSTNLSAKATTAARQISVTLQQQRRSAEQVAGAMQDIQQVTTHVSAGSTQSLSATHDLTRLATELKQAVEGFQI